MSTVSPTLARPAPWKIAAALATIYVAWGTTYFAIRIGVETIPPYLFSGTRIGLAGVVLLLAMIAFGQSIRVPGRELLWMWFLSLLLFVGGNGLLNVAEKTVNSGLASVLAATTTLWMALFETVWPWGELPHSTRLVWRVGWIARRGDSDAPETLARDAA